MIRIEPSDPMALINTHNLLANDPQIAPKYLANQEQAIAHFEDMSKLLGDDCVHACMRSWNTLPHSLQIEEYHSPMRLKEALKRVPMYKRSMQRLKVNWIGLKLSPPLLLGMLEGRREEEEEEQWRVIDRKARFYGEHGQTTAEAWDAREATRAIKDEEMD